MRVLVAGLGGIGQRHVRNLRALLGSDVEIDAYRVRKRSPVLTESFEVDSESDLETKYGIRAFDALEEALGQRPDAVFICNPSSLHMPVAMAAARAGCHLFIEKPLSNRWDGVDELIDLIEERQLIALVGYQMRFHPCLRRFHSLLEEGRIGWVLAVSAEVGEYLPGWHPYEDYRGLYAARRELGGGVILSQIHELDYLYWLFGRPRRLFALGSHLSSLEIDVEDTSSILMECVVDGRPFPVHLHQDFTQRPPARTCKVVGDEGKMVVDFHALTLEVYDGSGRVAGTYSFEDFQRNHMFLDEMRHFVACVRGEELPVVTVRDGAESLRMALAARQSIETGCVVDLT